jgi:hypothetical protein
LQDKVKHQQDLIHFYSHHDAKGNICGTPHEKEIWEINVRLAIISDIHREIFVVPLVKF